MHTYLVLDLNFLRSDSLKEMLHSQPELKFVLPDLAFFETAKSSNRELTIKLNLEAISLAPNRVYVSRALSDCLYYELHNRLPVVGHMINQDATKFARKLLNAIATGVSNAEYVQVIADTHNHLPAMRRDYLDHDANKIRSMDLVTETKQSMTPDFASRLRGLRVTTEEKIDFILAKAPSLLVGVLKDNDFSLEKANRLLRQKPMLLRYFFVKLWACLCWEEQGRIECLGAAKVTNDLIDHEYVLTATFFHGILSNEPAVNDAYAAVNQLLARF